MGLVVLFIASCSAQDPVAVSSAAPAAKNEPIAVVVFEPPKTVESYDTPAAELGQTFSTEIVNRLKADGHVASVAAADAPPPSAGLLVRGRLLRVNGGSHAVRFWIGLGAGRASVSAEGTVTRADGTELATFRERRSASGEAELGFSGDQYLVEKCLRVLAGDIAEMIDTGSYRQAALADEPN
jgi:hypothetical protein